MVRVLGIDPGLTRMGLAVVEESGGRLQSLAGDTVGTPPDVPTGQRLVVLWNALEETLTRWRPDAVAVERVFYNTNARTQVAVAQASGVALLAAARSGARVHEYTPLEVKQAVAGTGAASKEQVRFMVTRLLGLPGTPGTADGADACAVAICHLHGRKMRAVEEAAR